MGRRSKCLSTAIVVVLVGCATSVNFEYELRGRSPFFKAKSRVNSMNFFSNMFQTRNDRRPWSNMVPSFKQNQEVNHVSLYQKPIQQPDYERNFYNFGLHPNDVCSDEETDYSSPNECCQEPSIPDNYPDYTDQGSNNNCNNNEYGIRWKGSLPDQANIEIEEVVSKGGQSQWRPGGGEYEDEMTGKRTPNYSGLTNVEVHDCFPQSPQGRSSEDNGSQNGGNQYFVLVIKKEDARTLNKTSIDAIIGGSLKPTSSEPLPSSIPSVNDSMMTTSESSADSESAMKPTEMPVNSIKSSSSIATPNADEVSPSTDVPTKISIFENPETPSSSTPLAVSSQRKKYPTPSSSTPPAVSSQRKKYPTPSSRTSPTVSSQPKKYPTQNPPIASKTPSSKSKIQPDRVASQSANKAPKTSTLSKVPKAPEFDSGSNDLNSSTNTPLATVNPTIYSRPFPRTDDVAKGDSQRTASPSNAKPIQTTFPSTTYKVPESQSADLTEAPVEGYDSQSLEVAEAPVGEADVLFAELTQTPIDRNDSQSAELTEAPFDGADSQSVELTEASVGEADVLFAELTQTPIARDDSQSVELTEASVGEADSQSAEETESPIEEADLQSMELTEAPVWCLTEAPVEGTDSQSAELTDRRIEGDDSQSVRPTDFYNADRVTVTSPVQKGILQSPVASAVNDRSPVVPKPKPTSIRTRPLNDSTAMVSVTEPSKRYVTRVPSTKIDSPTIVNENSPNEENQKSSSFGSSDLSDSMQVVGQPKSAKESTTTVFDAKKIPQIKTAIVNETSNVMGRPRNTNSGPSRLNRLKPTVSRAKSTEDNSIPNSADSQLRTTIENVTFVATTSKEMTTTLPTLSVNGNSNSSILRSNQTPLDNDKRSNDRDAVADSQSEDTISNPNVLPNGLSTFVSAAPTVSNSQAAPNNLHEEMSPYDTSTSTKSQIGPIAEHNVHDLGHTIKGLQDLVNKLMTTVNSQVTPNVGLSSNATQTPLTFSGTIVTTPHSVEYSPGSKIVKKMETTSELPNLTPIVGSLEEDFNANASDSGKSPKLKDYDVIVGDSGPPSGSADNSLPMEGSSYFNIKLDNGRSSITDSTAIAMFKIPSVGPGSQSSRWSPKIVPTDRNVYSAVEQDSGTSSTANGRQFSINDSPTTESKLISVTRSENREPISSGSSMSPSFNIPAIVTNTNASDQGRLSNRNSETEDSSFKGLKSPNGFRDVMATGIGSSQSPNATVNGNRLRGNRRPLNANSTQNNSSSNAVESTKGFNDEISTNNGMMSSRSPNVMISKQTTDSQNILESPPDENARSLETSSQSAVLESTDSSRGSEAPESDEETVKSNDASTPVTENSYDASSFTSTVDPVPSSTEETRKLSPADESVLHSFVSWIDGRNKKNARNVTEELIESAFDPLENSDNNPPLIDKEILPETVANWFLGFRVAEDEDGRNESESSETLNTGGEFSDIYHSFLEAAIHNVNNASPIVNASEPVGTPFNWWSSFREAEQGLNITEKKPSSPDPGETRFQTSTIMDRGFMEGDIHRVNDPSPTVNESGSTRNRWWSKMKGYTSLLRNSSTESGLSAETNFEISSPSGGIVGDIHKTNDGSEMENVEPSSEQTGWFSRFWGTTKGSSSIVNGTQSVDVVEVGPSSIVNGTQSLDVVEVGSEDKHNFGNISEIASINGTLIDLNTTEGNVVSSQQTTASTATTLMEGVDDDPMTMEITFAKPKAGWSFLSEIQKAKNASVLRVNKTKKGSDENPNKPRTYSPFHVSDFKVW